MSRCQNSLDYCWLIIRRFYSYPHFYWHLLHYTVRKPIKTALCKLLFSNDRAVCIIVWHTVALVRTHSLNGTPVYLLTTPKGVALPCFPLCPQRYRVQRWGVCCAPGAARGPEAYLGHARVNSSASLRATWYTKRRYSRSHSAWGRAPHSRHRVHIRTAKEGNEQRLSDVLPRRGINKYVTFFSATIASLTLLIFDLPITYLNIFSA